MEFPPHYTVALSHDEIAQKWPNLILGHNCEITSLKNVPKSRYNCVAFVLGEENRDADMLIFSKRLNLSECGLTTDPLKHTVAAYAKLFTHFYKFEVCYSSDVEKGFTKIALYEGYDEDGEKNFLHAAILSNDGKWKSKLGTYEDVEHTLNALEGSFYGHPVLFMKRPEDTKIRLLE